MSAYYTKIYAPTEEEVRQKAKEEIDRIDFMRQPSLYSVLPGSSLEGKEGWVATIKYWGLD